MNWSTNVSRFEVETPPPPLPGKNCGQNKLENGYRANSSIVEESTMEWWRGGGLRASFGVLCVYRNRWFICVNRAYREKYVNLCGQQRDTNRRSRNVGNKVRRESRSFLLLQVLRWRCYWCACPRAWYVCWCMMKHVYTDTNKRTGGGRETCILYGEYYWC